LIFTSMRELDEMIRRGWGDTPQSEIPEDWRTRKPPEMLLVAHKLRPLATRLKISRGQMSESTRKRREAPSRFGVAEAVRARRKLLRPGVRRNAAE
jgi:hypothetical protein